MDKRKVTGTLEVVERTVINISFNMLVGILSYWDASKKKIKKGMLRYGATINEMYLVFPPEDVVLGSYFPLCVCGDLPLEQWVQQGYTGSPTLV